MLRVAHLGPPIARQGGPGGYLRQLRAAAPLGAAAGVLFPDEATPADRPSRGTSPLRRMVAMARRAVGAPPRFYRPSDDILRADHGHVEAVMTSACSDVLAATAASVDRARRWGADVLFCHESPAADHALAHRSPGQQVWLLLHAPMPLALYLVWNWGVPEKDWRDVMAFPDVRRWTTWELDVWRRVDRLIIPCAEAFDELVRIAPAADCLRSRLTLLLSGASAHRDPGPALVTARRRQLGLPVETPIALFLGNAQPYRGLDALMAGAESLPNDVEGIVAVAGPQKDALTRSRRVRPLGPVTDVGGLLDAVDFVVNVNRFSLLDLSTIEALETAKPVLLHAVGGNRTFAQLGAGCVMMDDLSPDAIAGGLRRMFALRAGERDALGRQSRRCYEAHLTPAHLWDRHAALYDTAAEPVGAR